MAKTTAQTLASLFHAWKLGSSAIPCIVPPTSFLNTAIAHHPRNLNMPSLYSLPGLHTSPCKTVSQKMNIRTSAQLSEERLKIKPAARNANEIPRPFSFQRGDSVLVYGELSSVVGIALPQCSNLSLPHTQQPCESFAVQPTGAKIEGYWYTGGNFVTTPGGVGYKVLTQELGSVYHKRSWNQSLWLSPSSAPYNRCAKKATDPYSIIVEVLKIIVEVNNIIFDSILPVLLNVSFIGR